MLHHGRGVARAGGVEGEPGVVTLATLEQRGEEAPVEGGAPWLGHGIRDRQAGDLVPEPQRAPVGDEQPGVDEGRVGRLGRVRDRPEQRGVDAVAGQGRDVEQVPGDGVEVLGSGQHRVAGGCREPAVRAAHHLGDEVGVAAGEVVHLGRVEAGAGDQLRDRTRGRGERG